MTTLDNQIAAFRLFNEKAEELLELSFVKAITNPNAGVTLSGRLTEDGSYEMRSEVRGPSTEAIKAFVLTFRYFIQNNETISFKNIADLYDMIEVDTTLKDQFRSAREAINEMLDSSNFMNLNYNNATPTNREIMDVFIYGGLAHANPQKYQLYKEWMNFPPAAVLLQNSFTLTLGYVLHAIIFISTVNQKVLQELEAQKK